MLNEQQIRKIVDDEIKKKLFTLPKIPPHGHTGSDNIKIPRSSIVNSTAAAFIEIVPPNGTQTITSGIVNPSQIFFDGVAYDGTATIQLTNYQLGQGGGSIGSQVATLASPWGGSTGEQLILFSSNNGQGTETRNVEFTNGSFTISWVPALTLDDSLTVTSVNSTHKSVVSGFALLGNVLKLTGNLTSTVKVAGGIYQNNVETFFDGSTGSWVPYVSTDGIYIAAVHDASYNLIASIQITAYTVNSITIATTGTDGYLLIGLLSMI